MAHTAPTRPARMPSRRKCCSNSRAMKRSVAPTKCSTSTISRLEAMALRGRRDDDGGRGGADQQQDGEAAEREGARDGADLALPAAVVVERDALELLAELGAQRRRCRAACCGRSRWRSGAAPGSALSASDLARARAPAAWRHRLEARGPARAAMPCWRDRKPCTSATVLSMSTLSCGSTWTVTSLAMSLEPGVRRLVDHVDGAGREAGEKAHDG